ncbi:MAG: insulinase family protein, partial [Hyphomicrobiales bacterium]|nr:insulinase family protein [Hyphomicrobiales bacterium]
KITIAQLEVKIDHMLDDIIKNGVQPEELDHARNSMIKSEVYSRDSQTTMARIIGAVFTAGGDLGDVVDWTSRLKKVTVEDVNLVARKYLLKSRSVTGYLLPKKQIQKADKS